MTESMSPTALPVGTVTTRLVHRPAQRATEWWHSAVVYVNAPPLLDQHATLESATGKLESLRTASRLGVQAVRIGAPPLPTEAGADVIDAVHELLTRAHRTGLRVTMRIDPMDPRDEAAARYWLARGADGLDLGPVSAESPVSHARYRELHALLAEHARSNDPILSTRLTADAHGRAGEMLHEDWLHHLVGTELVHLDDAALITESITASYRVRDALGTPGAWLVPDVVEAGSAQAVRSRALVALALPGAVYLREGITIDLPAKTSPEPDPPRLEAVAAAGRAQPAPAGSTLKLIRAALRLRADHRLGTAPLAWVEEMAGPVAPSVVAFLSGEVLVVSNLGAEEVPLVPGRRVLLSSAPLRSRSGGVPMLPAGETSWQWLEPAPPLRDPRARR
ncbi:hypothetical protein [Georgenia sp. MJ170]|uniref:hypothetical protein n=1 Tax=Georgenia sunbinii TaxID=3117728 RepID=UPI002F2641AA